MFNDGKVHKQNLFITLFHTHPIKNVNKKLKTYSTKSQNIIQTEQGFKQNNRTISSIQNIKRKERKRGEIHTHKTPQINLHQKMRRKSI